MKLIIQIPCYNEEKTLPLVFKKIPKKIEGIDQIEYQIIDDRSTDKTIEVAKKLGVHHIVTYRGKNRRWLGRAFQLGVENALKNGADILVNTDGDNQYPSDRIPELIKPIVEKRAEIVVGNRQTSKIKEFSPIKKFLQKIGSLTTEVLSGEKVPDAVSGFRAYSKEALYKINIITDYTYTVDTLMQAHNKGLDVEWLDISVNKKTRESRLIKSLWSKVRKSGSTILRMYAVYAPFKIFATTSLVFFIIGLILFMRFFYFFLIEDRDGLVQSLIIGSISLVIAMQMFSIAIIAELLAVNRRLIEDVIRLQKKSLKENER